MKPYHKSYWKTIVLAAGSGIALVGLATVWGLYGVDLLSKTGLPEIPLSWAIILMLLAPAALCFAVGIGGLLCVYRDITQDGRP